MPVTQTGVPKAGAPTFFTYEVSDLLSVFPGWANFLALGVLGLPSVPQYTADFCAQGPATDVAFIEDYGMLSNPPLAFEKGAYRRIANTFRAYKWDTLCEYTVPEPEGTGGEPDVPAGYRVLARNLVYPNPQVLNHTINFVWFPMPTNLRLWGFKQRFPPDDPDNALNFRGNHVAFMTDTAPPNDQDVYDLAWQASGVQAVGCFANVGGWEIGNGSGHDYAFLALAGFHGQVENIDLHFDLIYKPWDAVQPEPPEVPGAPGDYPAEGPCLNTTTDDLCQALAAAHTKLDYLISKSAPPEVVAPDEPIPVEPVDDPPPDGPVPNKPVAKPALAIGALISATVIPDYQARYGTGAVFYPSLGHVGMKTMFGWAPSVLIKHRQLVLLNMPPQVFELELDLSPGVEATVTWLFAA